MRSTGVRDIREQFRPVRSDCNLREYKCNARASWPLRVCTIGEPYNDRETF